MRKEVITGESKQFMLRNGCFYGIEVEGDSVLIKSIINGKKEVIYTFDDLNKLGLSKKTKETYIDGYTEGFRDGAMVAQELLWSIITAGLMMAHGNFLKNSHFMIQ